jgi:hypothetical protein
MKRDYFKGIRLSYLYDKFQPDILIFMAALYD